MSRPVVGSWAAGQRVPAAKSIAGRPSGLGRSLAQTGTRGRSTQQLPGPHWRSLATRSGRGPAPPAHSHTGAQWGICNDFRNAFRGNGYAVDQQIINHMEANEAELRETRERCTAVGGVPGSPPPGGLGWHGFRSLFKGFGFTKGEMSKAYQHYKDTGRLPGKMRVQPTQPPATGDGGAS